MSGWFGWPADDPLIDGCSYYRLQVPFERLLAEGLPVSWRHTIQEADVQLADVLYGQRISDPQVSPYWSQWASRRTSGLGAKLVADLDDDLFNVPEWSSAHEVYSRPEVRNTVITGVALADRVTVSTEPLARALEQYNSEVYVIPNSVPQWLLRHARPQRDHLVLGWAGSGTHAGDWSAGAWYGDDIEFHMMGGDPTWLAHLPEDARFRHTEWVSGVESYLSQIDFDVCVIPLSDHVFNLSKSGIKAMEMAALGIPVVAQNHVAYRDIVYHGVTGYLANTPEEMAWRVQELTRDDGLREEMGRAAREYASRHFTIDQTWRQWELAFTF